MSTRRGAGAVAVITALAAVGAVTAVAPAAAAGGSGVRVITGGLDGPFGIAAAGKTGFVAESVSGEVTQVFANGRKRVVFGDAEGVAAVGATRHRVYAVMGGEGAPGATYAPSTVLRSNYSGTDVDPIADLLDWELRKNPDGQKQFDTSKTPPEPYDTLSNPFGMNYSKRYGLLIADGGANDVLQVNPRTGRIKTFFVPPTVKLPGCPQANPGTVGCDPVPTGVDVVRGKVYVSTLGAEFPGAGRIYKLNHRGKVLKVWKGLTAPTGVAVSPGGTIYYSEVLFGAPEGDGPPPPGFDPSKVGRITRISPNGRVAHAQVTMPTGLEFTKGRLFSSAWSIASFLGIPSAGQVVEVRPSAFR